MADAVTSRVLVDDDHNYGIILGSVSDGSGESTVTKVTLANVHKGQDPVTRLAAVPIALDLMEIYWNVVTFTSVDLFWKATTNDRIIRLLPTGYGHISLTGRGALGGDTIRSFGAKTDTTATGYTGDILLTSSATNGGVYNIVLFFNKRFAV